MNDLTQPVAPTRIQSNSSLPACYPEGMCHVPGAWPPAPGPDHTPAPPAIGFSPWSPWPPAPARLPSSDRGGGQGYTTYSSRKLFTLCGTVVHSTARSALLGCAVPCCCNYN